MLTIVDHPLIRHKLTIMRKKETSSKEFRENLDEIGMLMGYEVTRNLPEVDFQIETPMAPTTGHKLAKEVVVVPILRAGLGMTSGLMQLLPTARVAHVGMYRNEETLQPVVYLQKYPSDFDKSSVIIVDPMLATGGSSVEAIDLVKKQGATDVRLVCLVGAPEGVRKVEQAHPDVHIYLAALDERLNENGYIIPGLGDAGDRIFGTL